MNAGRIMAGGIVLSALVAGAALYYLQVYHYYTDVSTETAEIRLSPVGGGAPESIVASDIRAIDATSSPIRFRACFTTPASLATLTETFALYEPAEPLTAPGWFDCFDARAIGAALEDGTALAFLGMKDVVYGIDRVVAIFPDGRGYAWHQINECGAVVFEGNPAPFGCPPPPTSE